LFEIQLFAIDPENPFRQVDWYSLPRDYDGKERNEAQKY
jgi:hypothetical protein